MGIIIYRKKRKKHLAQKNMSNLKLYEVIKQIRQCKTAAEERKVITGESA